MARPLINVEGMLVLEIKKKSLFHSHCGKDWIRQELSIDTNSRGNFIRKEYICKSLYELLAY